MAASCHVRSMSLPSRTHPLKDIVLEQLNRLRSTESTSLASSTCQSLGGLKDLYDCVDDWLQLSQTQQALSSDNQSKCIEHVLDGSLRLLDVCGIARDVLLEMKGSIQQLESSFRRMKGCNSTFANEIEGYIMLRKKMKKVISKSFESLRISEKQSIPNKEFQEESSLTVVREVEKISIQVFGSLLSFLSKPKTRSNRRSLVSKVLSSKRVSCEGVPDANQVEELDADLLALKSGKDNSIQIHNVLRRAEALESTIQEIVEILECVFRCLMKTRVSLLNILNH